MEYKQYITKESERKPGKHLTREDRGAIQARKKLGLSNRRIAAYLHCSPTTVSNERKRSTPPRKSNRGRIPSYSAKRGHAVYQSNRRNSRKPHKIHRCQPFVQWVITQIRKWKWSIDACVGYARKHALFPAEEMVSTKTLYNEVGLGRKLGTFRKRASRSAKTQKAP